MAEGKFTNIGEVLRGYSQKIMDALKKNLADRDLISSDRLNASIQFPVNIYGSKYVATLKMEDYWKEVDEGRKAGTTPNIDSLVKWIAHKGIDSVSIIQGMRKGNRIKSITPLKATKTLAFLIGRSIKRRGTIKRFGYKGSHFYSDVVNDKLKADITRDVSIATKKDIIVEINEIKKDFKNKK